MKSKEIYALVAVAILIVVFAVWNSAKNGKEGMTGDTSQGETAAKQTPPTTQTKKPSSSAPQPLPGSVNPTVVVEKPVPTIPTSKSLAGSTFRLATYNGTPLPADTKFTLTFTENAFTLKICNTMSSSYFIENDKFFRAMNVTSTQMYCSSPSNIMKMDSDASFMLSSSVTSIYKSGSTLILSHPSGIVFAFEGF